MMALMCRSCPELAVRLLSSDIVSTIRYLLVGQKSTSSSMNKSTVSDLNNTIISASSTSLNESSLSVSSSIKLNESVELLNRTPQELYEITSLIAELMPRLSKTGIFSINKLLEREAPTPQDAVVWSWRDDRGNWHRYNTNDNRIIETSHRSGDEEVTIVSMGKTYTIDFTTMQQINEETELSRPVQRKVSHQPTQANSSGDSEGGGKCPEVNSDPRTDFIQENPAILENFAQALFGVLYEIYSSSAGPSVRHKCLSAFLRIVYYSPDEPLRQLLKCHPVSSHIASMLGSSDQRILVGAIQMATILMDKLPDVFLVYFRREGVMHHFKKLANKTGSSSGKKEEVKDWIVKQAQLFDEKTSGTVARDRKSVV